MPIATFLRSFNGASPEWHGIEVHFTEKESAQDSVGAFVRMRGMKIAFSPMRLRCLARALRLLLVEESVPPDATMDETTLDPVRFHTAPMLSHFP